MSSRDIFILGHFGLGAASFGKLLLFICWHFYLPFVFWSLKFGAGSLKFGNILAGNVWGKFEVCKYLRQYLKCHIYFGKCILGFEVWGNNFGILSLGQILKSNKYSVF